MKIFIHEGKVFLLQNKSVYTYEDFTADIKALKEKNKEIPIFSIGRSVQGKPIFAIKLGNGTRRIFYSGAYHGMEHLTAKVLFEFVSGLVEGKYGDILKGVTLYVVPMVNPDGIEIAATGKPWQANARGVDINHNFDAMWHLSKALEESYGITEPGATRYGGEFPESEPEAKAVANFTRQNKFDMVMALHSQGQVIYYDFCGVVPKGTEEYLSRFEKASVYRRELPSGISSYGGYKDWFIKKFKKPGFTVEIGKGENPLPLKVAEEVYKEVEGILQEGLK